MASFNWPPQIGLGGTVTSVNATDGSTIPIFTWSGGPITSSGTLTETLVVQAANKILSGPTSGGSAQPTFRLLVGADLPNPSSSTLGGVQSAAAVSHQWINSISTSGVPALSQPAFTDISGTATSSQVSPASVTISALDINWNSGNVFSKTLSANSTFTFSNNADGHTIVVALTNTASNYTVTWPTVSWVAATPPVQTIGAHTDVYTFVQIGSTVYGAVVQNY